MLSITPTWRKAVEGQFRYQAFLKVNISIVPPGLREGMIATSPDTEPITDIESIYDTDRNTQEKVATFELNRWRGDGTFYLPSQQSSENAPMEWWSNKIPSAEDPVVIHVEFDQAYSIPGIYASWDTETNSWPTNIEITGYDVLGEIIRTATVTSVNAYEMFINEPFDDVASFDIKIIEWSKPEWRARINELIFGLDITLDTDRINQATQDDAIDVLNAKLPTAIKTVTIRNYDKYFDPTLKSGISKYLSQRQYATWQWGLMISPGRIEWLPQQSTYVDSASVPSESSEAQISFTSRLSFITTIYKRGVYTGEERTYYDLVLDVLQNTNILRTYDEEIPWILPESLKNYTTSAPTPVLQANSILQLAAAASGHVVLTDPVTDYIVFQELPNTTDREISKARSQGEPGVTIDDRLRSVKVGIYRYQFNAEESIAYSVDLNINGLTILEVEYANNKIYKDLTIGVTGGTLISSNLYSTGAEIKVSGVGTVSIVITGKELLSTITYIEYYNNPAVASGIDITVENELITNTESAQHVAQLVRDYYLKRQVYDIPYIIYPEITPYDLVVFNTSYGDDSGVVLEHHITFNGGWTGNIVIHSEEVYDNV